MHWNLLMESAFFPTWLSFLYAPLSWHETLYRYWYVLWLTFYLFRSLYFLTLHKFIPYFDLFFFFFFVISRQVSVETLSFSLFCTMVAIWWQNHLCLLVSSHHFYCTQHMWVLRWEVCRHFTQKWTGVSVHLLDSSSWLTVIQLYQYKEVMLYVAYVIMSLTEFFRCY